MTSKQDLSEVFGEDSEEEQHEDEFEDGEEEEDDEYEEDYTDQHGGANKGPDDAYTEQRLDAARAKLREGYKKLKEEKDKRTIKVLKDAPIKRKPTQQLQPSYRLNPPSSSSSTSSSSTSSAKSALPTLNNKRPKILGPSITSNVTPTRRSPAANKAPASARDRMLAKLKKKGPSKATNIKAKGAFVNRN